MGIERLLTRLMPLSEALRARESVTAADVVLGVDVRPWVERLDPVSAARVMAVIEGAWLVAQADGRFDRAERKAIDAVIHRLSGDAIWTDDVDTMFETFEARLAREGHEARCDSVGRALRRMNVSEEGVYLAAGIACVSNELSAVELGALERIAASAGLGFPDVAVMVSAIRADLAANP